LDKDPIDLLIQIRRPRVRLEDGTMLRINYDAHNGLPCYGGRVVPIERKGSAARRNEHGAHSQWMNVHPDQPGELRDQNGRSTLRIVGLSGELRPWALRRSADAALDAVDKALHRYGTPLAIRPALMNGAARLAADDRAGHRASVIVGPARRRATEAAISRAVAASSA
jgi:membrane-bound lytic murein transglycosylase A